MRVSYRLLSGDIGELGLKGGLRVGIGGGSAQKVVARLADGRGCLVRLELVRVVTEKGLLAREEVIRGGLGVGVLHVGLHCQTS